jgi:hypothetical protein
VVDRRRALVSLAIGREVVRRAALALEPAAIPVLVLKGAWLQSCVYGPDEPRVITDVDLLVPEAAFASAIERLERAGWRRGTGNLKEQTLWHSELVLPIDLHRRLFTRGAFNLESDAVLARAHCDEAAFGVKVLLHDPRDGFAHLLGHFVKSRFACGDAERLADFTAIARHCQLDPADCASHLHATGLARAARYALAHLAFVDRDPFFVALLAALPRDALAAPLARLARAIAVRSEAANPLGALPGFLLDRSLPAGARALVLRVLERGLERL